MWGKGLGYVLLFYLKKKKKISYACLKQNSNKLETKVFGCLCHEQDSIELEKFITWLNKWSFNFKLISLVIFLEEWSD